MDEGTIEQLVARAVDRAVFRDRHLLQHNCSETSFTHRIGVYLEGSFPEWDVECEYNRQGYDPKTLDLPDVPEKLVRPDIIIHRRGANAPHNLVVIEAKKVDGEAPELDFRKLRAFRDRLGYRVIAFLMLQTGDEHHPGRIGAHLAFGSAHFQDFGPQPPPPPRPNWFLR